MPFSDTLMQRVWQQVVKDRFKPKDGVIALTLQCQSGLISDVSERVRFLLTYIQNKMYHGIQRLTETTCEHFSTCSRRYHNGTSSATGALLQGEIQVGTR